jgi:hypothetical protein
VRAILFQNLRILFICFCAVLTFLLFSRTQSPNSHHLLPIFFWLFPSFVFGVTWPFSSSSRLVARTVWVIPALMLASFASVVHPATRERLAAGDVLLPAVTIFPLKVDRIDTFRALTRDLKGELKPGDRLAVFASSEISDAFFIALDRSLGEVIIPVAHVDNRDGFLIAPMKAQLAIVTDKPALHLPPEGQRVITIPNEMIKAPTGLGAGYRRVLGPYLLSGGITAFVYRRTRPLSGSDVAEIDARFRAHYPGWTSNDAGLGPQ